jgi:hypothetical protein
MVSNRPGADYVAPGKNSGKKVNKDCKKLRNSEKKYFFALFFDQSEAT